MDIEDIVGAEKIKGKVCPLISQQANSDMTHLFKCLEEKCAMWHLDYIKFGYPQGKCGLIRNLKPI